MYCIAQTAVLIFGSNVYLRCSELLYVISLEDGMLLLLQMLAVGFVIFNLFCCCCYLVSGYVENSLNFYSEKSTKLTVFVLFSKTAIQSI